MFSLVVTSCSAAQRQALEHMAASFRWRLDAVLNEVRVSPGHLLPTNSQAKLKPEIRNARPTPVWGFGGAMRGFNHGNRTPAPSTRSRSLGPRGPALAYAMLAAALPSQPHQAVAREGDPDHDKHASKHGITTLELDSGHGDPEDRQRDNNNQSHRVRLG